MLSRKSAFAGFFSRNDHQPARSRARTKVAVNLEILERRELLNGAHHPRFEQARNDQLEFRKSNLNADFSHVISKTEFRVMNLAPGHFNARRIPQFPGGGPSIPAPQITPPKLTLLSLGVPSPTSTLPTVVNNPVTPVIHTAPSGPATTPIQTPVLPLPAQPGSPGSQPVNAPGDGSPTSTAISTRDPAPIVHIDIIPPGPPSGPIFY